MKGRLRQRIRRNHFAKKRRRFGREVLVIWLLVVACWSFTGWALIAAIAYRTHVHIPVIVLLADLLFLVLAGWMTREWWRARDK